MSTSGKTTVLLRAPAARSSSLRKAPPAVPRGRPFWLESKFRIAALGGCLLLTGFAGLAYSWISPRLAMRREVQAREKKESEVEIQVRRAAAQVRANCSASLKSGASVAPGPANHKREQEMVLDALSSKGLKPMFVPVSAVRPPENGRTLALFCLLREPLDWRTERLWGFAGLFRQEPEVISPYLRLVTVSTPEEFDLLQDERVEGVAYELLAPLAAVR